MSAGSEGEVGQQPDPTAWGQDITDERKRELDELAERQHRWAEQPEATRGDSPLKDEMLTGAEVFWLAECVPAEPDGDIEATEVRLRDADVSPKVPLLHLEGANLRAAHLEGAVLFGAHLERADLSGAHLKGAYLSGAHLDGADFSGAHLAGADFSGAHLEGAQLLGAHLEGAVLFGAHLEGADFSGAHLERADLRWAHLDRPDLSGAQMQGADLSWVHLEGADLSGAQLEGANLRAAHLEGANLSGTHLEGADLRAAHVHGADLSGAHMHGADLRAAHLEAADFIAARLQGKTYLADDADWLRIRAAIADFPTTLPPTDLREAFLDSATTVRDVTLCAPGTTNTPRVADTRWGGVNLAVLDWTPFTEWGALLGDEWLAHTWRPKPYQERDKLKSASRRERATARNAHAAKQQRARLDVWSAATRANRQVATTLRGQGMSDEADHFAFRAQVCQRRLLQYQGKRGRALFSHFLNLLAGYGYKPERTLVAYGLVLAVFTGLYLIASYGWLTFGLPPSAVHTLQWYEALVLSISSFHGRGFFQPLQNPGDPIAILAAIEAVCGLIIEISFIATFTQRIFGAK